MTILKPTRVRRIPIIPTTVVALLIAATSVLSAPASLGARSAHAALPVLRLSGDAVGLPQPGFPFYNTNANLVRLLPESGKVVADLAHWRVSKNHLVYTFTIRKNARFSNGHYVTAQDVVFSLKRSLTPNTGSYALTYSLNLIRGAAAFNAGKTKSLSGVKVLATRVLQITITKPVAYFLLMLSLPPGDVFDPAVLAGKRIGRPPDFKNDYLATTCVADQGAGPFKLLCRNKSSTPKSYYARGARPGDTLVPNPYYYGSKPRIKLEWLVFGDFHATYRGYLAGKVDGTALPSEPLLVRRWKATREFYPAPLGSVDYLTLNLHSEPFNNLHCRLALAYAIDRETLANNVMGGFVRATNVFVPPGMLGWYNGKDNPHFNPAKARAELAKCPGRTRPVELVYVGGDPTGDNQYAAILGMLRTVGMNIKLKLLSQNDWQTAVGQSLDKSGIQLIQDAWIQDYPDPQDFCTLLLHSGSPFNIGGWHSAAYDRLVDRADVTLNRTKRARLYIQAQHLLLSQGGVIVLDNGLSFGLIKPYVHGIINTVAIPEKPVPKNGNWANVWISPH